MVGISYYHVGREVKCARDVSRGVERLAEGEELTPAGSRGVLPDNPPRCPRAPLTCSGAQGCWLFGRPGVQGYRTSYTFLTIPPRLLMPGQLNWFPFQCFKLAGVYIYYILLYQRRHCHCPTPARGIPCCPLAVSTDQGTQLSGELLSNVVEQADLLTGLLSAGLPRVLPEDPLLLHRLEVSLVFTLELFLADFNVRVVDSAPLELTYCINQSSRNTITSLNCNYCVKI